MAKQDVELKFSLIDGVSRSLGEIQKGVTGLGASLVKVNATADLTGKAFAGIKAAGNFLADQATGVGNFENSLASLQAVTGASADELGRLKDAAIAASQSSIFSSTQAADGLTELARAGFDAAESISALNPVLALAQGQQLEVGESTQFVTTTLTQFGLAASEAGRVADVLASAADKSSLDVRQLGLSLSYAAPIAKQVGLTLEETTAIIGKLADEGFRGERGGTALANVFTALIDPSSRFSKSLDDAGIKTRDFSEVMQALADKGEGATKILLTLDTTARPAITALASKGSAGIRELTKALSDSGGAAQRTADILGATFSATVQKFENNITNLRNAILTPILAPLSDEIQIISDRLIAFSQSPEFDIIAANFTKVATAGIQGFGEFIASVDFTEVLQKTIDFSTALVDNLGTIAKAVEITGRVIGGFGDLVSITFQSLKGVTADVAAAIIEPLAVFNDEAEGLWQSLKAQAKDSEKSVGASLGKLGERFTGVSNSADSASGSLGRFGAASKSAKERYAGLAESIIPAPLLALADAAAKAAAEIEGLRVPPQAAKLSLGNLAKGADTASLSLNQLQERLRTVREALENAPQGSLEFVRLAQDAAKLEEEVRKAKVAIDDASGAMGNQAEAADKLRIKLQQLRGVQGDVVQGNNDIDESGQSASEALNEIGRKSSAVEISLGNLTEAYVREALAAAGSAKSARDYIRTLNGYFATAADIERQIQNRIDTLSKQNVVLSEEDQIRARLIQQYGNSSRLIEELVQQELRLAEAKRKGNDEAERGIEIEQRRAAQAGAIGTSAAAQAGPFVGATGGKGSATAPTTTAATVFNVQIDGLTAAGIREVVPEIERELSRLGALRR